MARRDSSNVADPLYGEVLLSGEVADLARQPLVQRLRHIRLSNIDSLSMPSIANNSRYEHSLGTWYLASRSGLRSNLSSFEAVILEAAALLHDTAITPFGHLSEEALAYLGTKFNHERKWYNLFSSIDSGEIGGFSYLQLFLGRESGLRSWAEKSFASRANDALESILEAIMGRGQFAGIIAGEIDLDNIDNVCRVAYHLGIPFEESLPVDLAQSMVSSSAGGVVFSQESPGLISTWLSLRRSVYDRLMLSRDDFSGKLMLISSMIRAYEKNVLQLEDWRLVDFQLIERLVNSAHEEVSDPAKRWLLGDLWSLSDLLWFQGQAPAYNKVRDFSVHCETVLKRHCFAYRIKDKRTRLVKARLRSGESLVLGAEPVQWLLGVGSALRQDFTSGENRLIARAAADYFKSSYLGLAEGGDSKSLTLF